MLLPPHRRQRLPAEAAAVAGVAVPVAREPVAPLLMAGGRLLEEAVEAAAAVGLLVELLVELRQTDGDRLQPVVAVAAHQQRLR